MPMPTKGKLGGNTQKILVGPRRTPWNCLSYLAPTHKKYVAVSPEIRGFN
jgi:hypothetical protein